LGEFSLYAVVTLGYSCPFFQAVLRQSGENKMATKESCDMRSLLPLMFIAGWFAVFTSQMAAQSPGNKTVFNSSNNFAPSTVWVDASAWWTSSGTPDLCLWVQQNILTSSYNTNYPNGTVIDARGLYPGIGGSYVNCSVDPFGALTVPPPSTTLLLPGGMINATATWTVPNNTRIVGDEQGTKIVAQTSFSGTGYIIEMGGPNAAGYDLCPSNGCTSVGLEHLFLGGGNVVNGIDNKYSQIGSYVNDINLFNFFLTGISIEPPSTTGTYPGATNSGPYSNISYVANGYATCTPGSSCPLCIDLEVQTQGIHGLTCIGSNGNGQSGNYTYNTPQAAGILVNASNNTIEDVHIESFWDGFEVGLSGTVSNVLISNVTGTMTGTVGPTENTVHLCGTNYWNKGEFNQCRSSGTVEDVTILNVMNSSPPSNGIETTAIADDVTANAIASCRTTNNPPGCATVLSTAIYALGELDGVNTEYSKLTTTPATKLGNYGDAASYIPTWGVQPGATQGGNQNGAPCNPVGAIFSQISGTGNGVYVCTVGGTWQAIH
jgi:hypothetical protein